MTRRIDAFGARPLPMSYAGAVHVLRLLFLVLGCLLPGCGAESAAAPNDPKPPAPAKAPPALKVVSYNTWGVPTADDLGARFARLPAALLALDADVVCLQEVWMPAHREALQTALSPTYAIADSTRGGLLLASRHPIRKAVFTPFEPVEGMSFVERLAGKGWLAATIEGPWGLVRVVTTHLAHRGPNPIQFRALVAAFPPGDSLPLVVAGDLNVQPDDPLLDEARAQGWVDARPTVVAADGTLDYGLRTWGGWPRTLPRRPGGRPDHILLRGANRLEYGVALDEPAEALSDHNLIWATIGPPEQATAGR